MYSTEDLMKELRYFYEPISNIYNKGSYFVYLKKGTWQVLKDKEILVETKNHMDILVFLIDNKLDLNEFDRLMSGCIKTRYVYMKSKIKKIEELFTTEELIKAEEDMDDFKKGLSLIIRKQTSGFKIIKGEKDEI